ncbi:MAG: acetoacetate decarboxylase [Proteobacteria bacterium]|jgi:acetoacetate decarboxylase|nr:acetoacetate decarboxylase [Pseudomonadota bacterium]
MTEEEVKQTAFAMPLTSPTYPRPPYRFYNREFFIITYRTTAEAIRAVLPAPLEFDEKNPIVKYEFIRMPDSTGFGDYTESGQVIPCTFKGRKGSYTHAMYLNDDSPIAGGRELWGFPKKLAEPSISIEKHSLVGVLKMGSIPVAVGSMGYKHQILGSAEIKKTLQTPSWLLKIIPHVDASPRILELVEYTLDDITMKGAWSGPAALELFHHAHAPVGALPVIEVISGTHILSDLTLGLGKVVHDYLAN